MEMVTPRIDILENGATYGKFVVEPLAQGFGNTLGNALRRVLMSSIPGAAVTSLKIDGVLHQFSTMEGVKEDVTEFILNLRNLFVKVHSPSVGVCTISLNVTGPGEVTGADIQTPAEVEVVNPEIHLATLSDETSKLVAEMTVEIGKGYVLPDEQKNVPSVIGIMPMASVFTPVRKVSYSVEPTRVGHDTKFDRLTLEVTTNGTIVPSDAVSVSAKILTEQLKLFVDFAGASDNALSNLVGMNGTAASGSDEKSIEELDFSVRTYNCLKKANILTIPKLTTYSENDLKNIRNFGTKSLVEVIDKLKEIGLSLSASDGVEKLDNAEDVESEVMSDDITVDETADKVD